MAELGDALRLYGRMISLLVRAQLQYRVSFLDMAFGSFVASAVEAVDIWALFDRFGMLAGSTLVVLEIDWTTKSLELMNTLTYGGTETAQYPLVIYRPWFRRFFTYVIPLVCISYFPAVAIFGIEDPLGTSLAFQVAAPVAGFAFLALALAIWGVGIRHYASTGS